MTSCLLLATLGCCILAAWSCESNQYQNGCKIYGNTCTCAYGCSSEFIYQTRRACNIHLRKIQAAATAAPPLSENVSNICYNMPCYRGICVQTPNDPGFICKCEGTGFYGHRCEKVIPVAPTAAPPLPENVSNICSSMPCSRGICIQTTNDPGFTCKCDGTGFYGHRCEKACPTIPISGLIFPYECIVI